MLKGRIYDYIIFNHADITNLQFLFYHDIKNTYLIDISIIRSAQYIILYVHFNSFINFH